MSKLLFQDAESGSEYQAWFAEVILPVAVQGTFTYRVPSDLIDRVKPGQRIAVQFGKKKIYTALIVSLHQDPPKGYTAKYFLEILDEEPIVSETQLRFWHWMAEYYCCTMGEVMDAALPANMKLESESKIILHPEAELRDIPLTDKEGLVMLALRKEKELPIGKISEILDQKTVLPIVKSMYEKGLIILKEELTETYRIKTETFVSHAVELEDSEDRQALFKILEAAPKQSDVLLAYVSLMREGKPIMKRKLLKMANASAPSLDALEAKGILSTYEAEVDRVNAEGATSPEFTLNEDQQKAIHEIKEAFEKQDVVLLHGVTGSGKTHVYMQLINETLAEGKQALYLVPEIALTAQLIGRLRATYGEKIGIYHSKFSSDERMEIWNKVRSGTYQVVLGVRSALFMPFENLGLLIIDEEHEHTFKQFEPSPRYHARDAGIFLMTLMGGKTILGTATPSFESYFNALRGKYGLVKMHRRWGDVMMPQMQIADLRDEYRKKSMKSHFSGLLYTEMNKTLKTGGQVILFQNRRGYAPILECTTCGWVPMCQNCDISLTYHQSTREVICHYCGYKEPSPKKCKACGNFSIKMLGFGTEKIEDELKIFFPENASLRMDQDTTRGKNSYAKIIQALEEGEAQILVGTQMVTKGLDFENVRLVGILSADQMLRFPDFRAVERSYQLMSQVAGRAGRRGIQGKVVIQTFNSPHPVFTFLLAHDYEGFYDHEIQERIDFKYPPFYKLIRLILRDEKEEKVQKAAHALADSLRDIFGFRVLGPEAPAIARIRGRYVMNILLKFERQNMNMPEAKRTLMREVALFKGNKDFKGVRLVVDVDPY